MALRCASALSELWLFQLVLNFSYGRATTRVKPAAAQSMPDGFRPGESRLRLQTIVRLRWLAVLGQSLTVIGAYWVLGIDLPIGLLPGRDRARRLGSMSRSASAIPRASASNRLRVS